jgi:hypothetical protein
MSAPLEQRELSIIDRDVIALNRYTIEARYPGDWEPIDETEARAAVGVARTVHEQVHKLFAVS